MVSERPCAPLAFAGLSSAAARPCDRHVRAATYNINKFLGWAAHAQGVHGKYHHFRKGMVSLGFPCTFGFCRTFLCCGLPVCLLAEHVRAAILKQFLIPTLLIQSCARANTLSLKLSNPEHNTDAHFLAPLGACLGGLVRGLRGVCMGSVGVDACDGGLSKIFGCGLVAVLCPRWAWKHKTLLSKKKTIT